MGQEKLAHEALAELAPIVRESATHMEKMASELASMSKRAGDAEHELQCMKLARRMEQRGIEAELDFEEKVAKLMPLNSTKLASMENAVEIAAGGFRLGAPPEKVAAEEQGSSRDELENWVSSNRAYS